VNISVAGSDHPDVATVRAALEQGASSGAQSQAAAVKVSPLVALSMRGSGTATIDLVAPCPGVTCNSSMGGCACFTIQGNITGTPIGTGTWTSNLTVNTDDCTNTGTSGLGGSGFCCFGGGVLTAKTGTGKSASTLAMSFTGPICSDPNDADSTNGGATSIQGGFIVLTAKSNGKFLHSAGSGQINASVGIDAAGTTYLAGNGTFQLVSPF
jgi:hypothetical protein